MQNYSSGSLGLPEQISIIIISITKTYCKDEEYRLQVAAYLDVNLPLCELGELPDLPSASASLSVKWE